MNRIVFSGRLHPACIVLVYAFSVWMLFCVPVAVLGTVIAVWALVLAFIAPQPLAVAVRRTRILLASIVLVYVLGDGALWQGQAVWDGAARGAEQAGRVLGCVLGLVFVNRRLSRPQWVSALWTLLAPLAPCQGLRERVAVRVALVLELAQGEVGKPGLRSLLMPDVADASAHPAVAVVGVERVPFSLRDAAVLVLALCVVVAIETG